MNFAINVVGITLSADADVLTVEDGTARALLGRAAEGLEVECDWSVPDAVVEGKAGTDFLKVEGFPGMLAFRSELSASSGLELYLENGELLSVRTSLEEFTIWHLPARGVFNSLDRSCIAGDGTVGSPKFLRHRLPGSCALFAIAECPNQLFVQARDSELTPAIGGPPGAASPPEGSVPEDWRSFLQEYLWRGWTGLEFRVVWRGEP